MSVRLPMRRWFSRVRVRKTAEAIVTIDAMGCQRDIAKKITDHDADYILALGVSSSSFVSCTRRCGLSGWRRG